MKKKNTNIKSRSSIQFVVATFAIIFAGMSGLFLYGKFIQAAPFTFSQSAWAGGITANTAVHPTNQTGWTEYTAKHDVVVGADVRLNSFSKTFTDDVATIAPHGLPPSGGGFANGTTTDTLISGGWIGPGDGGRQVDSSIGLGIGNTYPVGGGPSSIAFDVTNNAIWVVNNNDNTVTKLNATTGAPVGGPITVGSSSPVGLAFDVTNNAIWITSNLEEGWVNKYDAATGLPTAISVSVGTSVSRIAFDITNNAVWAINQSNSTVNKINAETGDHIGTPIVVGSSPTDIAFDVTNNAIWVTDYIDHTVTKINAVTGEIIGSPIVVGNNPTGIAFDVTNNVVWVANQSSDTLSKINATTGDIISTIAVGRQPQYVAFDITSNAVWVTNYNDLTISKIDAVSGDIIDKSFNTAYYPAGIAFDITNNAAWVTNSLDDSVTKFGAYLTPGTFESAVIDFGEVSTFLTLFTTSSTPLHTTLTMDVRAGNVLTPDESWTAWSAVGSSGDISALSGNQYIQYRANFSTTDDRATATLGDVIISSTYWTFVDDGEIMTWGGIQPFGSGFYSGTNSNTEISGSGASVVLGAATNTYAVGINPVAIAFDITNNAVWVANKGDNTVTKLNATTGAVVGSPIVVGNIPYGIAFDVTNNAIWVANYSDNTVTELNAATGAAIGSPIAVGGFPDAITFDITNNAVWVANYGDNTVTKLNAATGAVIGSPVAVGINPAAIAFDVTNNVVWVANEGDNTVTELNAVTGAVIGSPIVVGNLPYAIAFDVTNNAVWVANALDATVTKLNAATGAIIGSPIVVGYLPSGVAFDVTHNAVWVANRSDNTVAKLDATTGTVIGSPIVVGDSPWGIVFDITNNAVWVVNDGDNTVTKLNQGYFSSGTFTSSVIDLLNATFSTISWDETKPVNTDITMEIRASMDGVTWSPDWTAVLNGGDISALNGNEFIQYRATLTTSDGLSTPALNEVTINYSQYQTGGRVFSSVYDAGSADNSITKIAWGSTGITASEIVALQVRSSPDGLRWSNWCGPTICYDDTNYFEEADNGVDLSSNHPLKVGGNDRYFQYRARLDTLGYSTPVLTSVTISYDVTSGSPPPPSSGGGSFAVGPTSLSGAATSVTNVSAVLNGTVNSNGITGTTRWFEWGTSALGLSNQTTHMPHTDIPSGTTATLSWSGITGATVCKINGGQYVNKVVSCAGGSLITDTLTTNTTYILTASNGFGPVATKSINVVLP